MLAQLIGPREDRAWVLLEGLLPTVMMSRPSFSGKSFASLVLSVMLTKPTKRARDCRQRRPLRKDLLEGATAYSSLMVIEREARATRIFVLSCTDCWGLSSFTSGDDVLLMDREELCDV